MPSFQLRRDALDEHLLATAVAEGAELLRPARVQDVELGDFDHRVTIERAGRRGDGVLPLGARRHRPRHLPRQAARPDRPERGASDRRGVGRWKNVRHIDDLAARGPASAFAQRGLGSRRLSTNHYMGFGYWIWVIPLGNGETSIGVVYDTRLIELDHGPRPRARLPRLPRAPSRPSPSCSRAPSCASTTCAPTRTCPTSPASTWGRAGRSSATPRRSSIPYYSPGLDHAAFTRRGHGRDHQGRPGGGGRAGAHRRAQRDLRALLPPLLPGRCTRTSTTTWASRTCSRRRSCSTPRSTTSSW